MIRRGTPSTSGCILALGAILHWRHLMPIILALSVPNYGGNKNLWCQAIIDYSAANEYVQAHYPDLRGLLKPYFGNNSKRKEAVYNARLGVLEPDGKKCNQASLSHCGFTLCSSEAVQSVSNWTDLAEIRTSFLPQVRCLIEDAYPEDHISDIIFWNPMRRSNNLTQTRDGQTTPTANFASLPHIDLDVNAHEDAASLVDLIMKNQLNDVEYDSEQIDSVMASLEKGRRFAIVNAWSNLLPTPVDHAPLALLATRHAHGSRPFPYSSPDMSRSRWYTFPGMTQSEVLLFCQYDRDERRPSDLWHCAINPICRFQESNIIPSTRTSFDIRCLVIFDSLVPTEFDRFNPDRPRSLLTRSGSREFCSSQSKARRAEIAE